MRSKFVQYVLIILLLYFLYNIVKYVLLNRLHSNEKLKINLHKVELASKKVSSCVCRENDLVLLNKVDEFIEIDVTSRNSSKFYKLNKKQLESSNMACDPFKVLRRGPNQKVIGYSVYGKKKIYYRYLKSIIKHAKQYYPDWTIRVYHDNDTDPGLICELECLKDNDNQLYDNIDFCNIEELAFENLNLNYMIPTFWRWLPIGDHFVDAFMSRDSDSCIIEREVNAVNEWLNSNYLFHIMRDHPQHDIYMLAGLWGLKTNTNRNLAKEVFNLIVEPSLKNWHLAYRNEKQADQIFLKDHLYKIVKGSVMAHDSFHCEKYGGQPYPNIRPGHYCHVGGYGCCGPESSNYNYSFPHECPEKCRPYEQKEWIFC